MHNEVSFAQQVKFREGDVSPIYYLPGFYPSVEPRHDETGNSWTRHSQLWQPEP
jgi:hypothetical protein